MSFKAPRKRILSKEQLDAFQFSETYQTVISYIETLNEAVVGVKSTDSCSESEVRFSFRFSLESSGFESEETC